MHDLIQRMQETAKVRPKAVETKEWGTVYVRSLTVAELEQQSGDEKESKDKRVIARGAARVLCDEAGQRIFDPENDEHLDLIGKQPWNLLRQVLDASEKHNATSDKAVEEAKNA